MHLVTPLHFESEPTLIEKQPVLILLTCNAVVFQVYLRYIRPIYPPYLLTAYKICQKMCLYSPPVNQYTDHIKRHIKSHIIKRQIILERQTADLSTSIFSNFEVWLPKGQNETSNFQTRLKVSNLKSN